MNYCSNCGSKNLKWEVPEGDDFSRHVCGKCGVIHYTNPRMIVGCLVEEKGKILLCKRAIEPRLGLWNLPCGFLENGETVEQGALRETWEESQVKAEIEQLHCIYNLPHVNQVYLIYKAKMKVKGHGVTSESSEVEFFHPDDIPWDEIAFTSTTFALKKHLEFSGKEHTQPHTGTFHKFAGK